MQGLSGPDLGSGVRNQNWLFETGQVCGGLPGLRASPRLYREGRPGRLGVAWRRRLFAGPRCGVSEADGDMGVLTRGGVSRRRLIQGALAAGSVAVLERSGLAGEVAVGGGRSLAEFGYEQVEVRGERQVSQRENVSGVLMGLDEDSLLKPFREMAGQPGPGANLGTSLGGWYAWNPTYDFHHDDTGFAPASQFGQWMSAIARMQASSRFGGGAGRPEMRERVVRLNGLMAETISPEYFAKTRFAAYTLDKLVCGAMDAHRLLGDTAAFEQLDRVTAAAAPSLPGHALEREVQWRPGADISWMWDENYTMPENLYLISTMGAGGRYRQMAEAYMADEQIFEPLSRGVNVLSDKHAYSYVNALCSAMQAYFTGGSAMHFAAAKNGFQMVEQQSFATGGWGPDELLRKPGYDQIAKSLVVSHNSFETPCGSYAHMKLTRYLLRATRDGRVRGQHGACAAQHGAGIDAAPGGRAFVLLRGLQRGGEAGVFAAPLAVLLGYAAAGGSRLRDQWIFAGAGRGLGELVSAVGGAVDGGRECAADGADDGVSGERQDPAADDGLATGAVCAPAAGSWVGRCGSDVAGERAAGGGRGGEGVHDGGAGVEDGGRGGAGAADVVAAGAFAGGRRAGSPADGGFAVGAAGAVCAAGDGRDGTSGVAERGAARGGTDGATGVAGDELDRGSADGAVYGGGGADVLDVCNVGVERDEPAEGGWVGGGFGEGGAGEWPRLFRGGGVWRRL